VLGIQHVKPENKAALTVGAQTALVTAAAAILLPTPVSWGAAIIATYRMAKRARIQSLIDQGQAKYWRG
jgi:ABC-type phosphate transport system permease subunit